MAKKCENRPHTQWSRSIPPRTPAERQPKRGTTVNLDMFSSRMQANATNSEVSGSRKHQELQTHETKTEETPSISLYSAPEGKETLQIPRMLVVARTRSWRHTKQQRRRCQRHFECRKRCKTDANGMLVLRIYVMSEPRTRARTLTITRIIRSRTPEIICYCGSNYKTTSFGHSGGAGEERSTGSKRRFSSSPHGSFRK